MILTLVASSVYGVAQSGAWFTDQEQVLGNSIDTGTIDIAVDDQNPWEREGYILSDLKPSQVEYIEFLVHNVGSNPLNLLKKLRVYHEDGDNNPMSEPECEAEGGTWVDYGDHCSGGTEAYDLESVINYDMTVWVYSTNPTNNPGLEAEWHQVIYTDDMNIKLSDIHAKEDMMLGMIPANWYMVVRQSYHMPGLETGNVYQGDKVHFDITLTAEQLKGTVLMENKRLANTNESTIAQKDDFKGVMTYGVKDATFDWSFTGKVPLANIPYAAIFYYETWSIPSGNAPVWPRDVYVLATDALSDGSGNLDISLKSEDFNHDVTNMKFWLVPTSDLKNNVLGNDQLKAYTETAYLFELGMMDYYDADL